MFSSGLKSIVREGTQEDFTGENNCLSEMFDGFMGVRLYFLKHFYYFITLYILYISFIC